MSRGSKSCLVQLAFEFADFSAHFCMIDRVKREESRQLSQTRSIRKEIQNVPNSLCISMQGTLLCYSNY
jgi:hypothetical protein